MNEPHHNFNYINYSNDDNKYRWAYVETLLGMYVEIHIYTFIYIHINIYKYINTCINTHTINK